MGGSYTEYIYDIALDSSNNVYVAGVTYSDNFPGQGGFQSRYGGGSDGFISKLNPDLSNLIASTYLGGSSLDEIYAIALDGSGNVYVAGYTSSTDFPATSGVYQSANAGGNDGFISKLSSDLSNLIASTYFGGSNNDWIYAIALDGSGNVYVAGHTGSSDFPTTSTAYQTTYKGGGADGFVSKLNPDLSNLIASTYLGGGNFDHIDAIVLDSSGNVYVAGRTDSTDFPTTPNAFQKTNASVNSDTIYDDGFISKLSSNLTANNPPVINSFNANPNSGNAPLTVTFSWNVSDPDGDVLTCYLDVDNDGNSDYTINDCANNASLEHTYNNPGSYTAKLTVKDGYDGIDSKTVSITVTSAGNNPPSINSFNANPNSGNAPLTVTFSWNVNDPDGDVLTCYLDVDNDGNNDYTINDCVNNTSQEHTYNNPGNYTAKLTVDDGNGGTDSKTVSISVTSAANNVTQVTLGGGGGCSFGSSNSSFLPFLILLFTMIAYRLLYDKLKFRT